MHPGYVATDMTAGKGVIQPKDSVEGMTKVIAGATAEDNGKFLDYKGEIVPW